MKKKVVIIPLIILLSIILVIGIIILNQNTENRTTEFKKVTIKTNEKIRESSVYTDYKKFNSNIKSDITKEDFNHNNYLLIPIQIDPCAEKNITPTSYKIKNNTIAIQVKYKAVCGGCAPDIEYFILPIKKNITDLKVDLKYKAMNNPHCDPNVAYKPIIYLYPKEKTEVKVVLKNKELLTTTYPKYKESWNVIANPDGTLNDLKTNREYYGLFWEGINHPSMIHDTGFVIKGEKTITFLEEKLKILGLTDKEANEFIIYWLPKLEMNSYNYIYFETIEEIEKYMPLSITPSPDTLIRIQMDYKPLKKPIKVKEQELKSKNREGFTVVEWGGSRIQ